MNGGPANGVSNTADVGNPAVNGVDQIPIFPPELKVTFSRYYFLKTQLQNDTLEKKTCFICVMKHIFASIRYV